MFYCVYSICLAKSIKTSHTLHIPIISIFHYIIYKITSVVMQVENLQPRGGSANVLAPRHLLADPPRAATWLRPAFRLTLHPGRLV